MMGPGERRGADRLLPDPPAPLSRRSPDQLNGSTRPRNLRWKRLAFLEVVLTTEHSLLSLGGSPQTPSYCLSGLFLLLGTGICVIQHLHSLLHGYHSIQLSKTWNSKWCALYSGDESSSPHLKMSENQNATSKKVLRLDNIKEIQKVSTKSKHFVIEIQTRKDKYLLALDTEEELDDWLKCFQNTVSQNLKSSLKLDSLSDDSNTTVEESGDFVIDDNAMYSSSDLPLSYEVEISRSEASSRLQLSGLFVLNVNPFSVSLHTCDTKKQLYFWPYRYIRRYGKGKTTFTFEAGRKCNSGEGVYTFSSNEAGDIFDSIAIRVDKMKEAECKMTGMEKIVDDLSTGIIPRTVSIGSSGIDRYSYSENFKKELESKLASIPGIGSDSLSKMKPVPAKRITTSKDLTNSGAPEHASSINKIAVHSPKGLQVVAQYEEPTEILQVKKNAVTAEAEIYDDASEVKKTHSGKGMMLKPTGNTFYSVAEKCREDAWKVQGQAHESHTEDYEKLARTKHREENQYELADNQPHCATTARDMENMVYFTDCYDHLQLNTMKQRPYNLPRSQSDTVYNQCNFDQQKSLQPLPIAHDYEETNIVGGVPKPVVIKTNHEGTRDVLRERTVKPVQLVESSFAEYAEIGVECNLKVGSDSKPVQDINLSFGEYAEIGKK